MTAEIINLAEYRRKREAERAAAFAAANTIVGGNVAAIVNARICKEQAEL